MDEFRVKKRNSIIQAGNLVCCTLVPGREYAASTRINAELVTDGRLTLAVGLSM